jgi:glyoxylase-like metal-dependent hydrolase (beta-lactamase superfamily II)
MQITMFQSAQGDCLLLSDTGDRTRILVDAGMPDSYSTHVAPALARLRTRKKDNIDLVYVSHIDRDHIGGVLRMLDDEVLWRVHDHKKKDRKNNPGLKPPRPPRPPVISASSRPV